MGKSITVKRKSPGRPATGTDPLVGVRFPSSEIARIDAWAGANGISRSEAIRRLIGKALASPLPAKHNARMAPQTSDPPGMERDNHGKEIPLRKRTMDDQQKAKRASGKKALFKVNSSRFDPYKSFK
jgi:hypothetical protein